MRCPVCQHELIKTKVGSFCLHCGYAGVGKPEPVPVKTETKPVKVVSHAAPKPEPEPTKPNLKDSATKAKQATRPAVKVTTKPMVPVPPPIHLAEAEPMPAKPAPAQVFHPLTPITTEHEESVATGAVSIAKPAETKPTAPAEAVKTATPPPPPDKPAVKHHDHREHPHHISTVYLIIIIAIVIGLGLAAYVLPAKAAVKSFNAKLANAASYRFSGNIKLTGSSFLQVLNSDLNYDGVYHAGGASQVKYQGTFASRQYNGQFITAGSKLYTQMSGNDLPFIRYNQGLNTYHILPATWYSSSVGTGLYKYYCETKPDTKFPSPLVWYQALRQVKINSSAIIEYGAKVDGHTTTHVRGRIDSHSLGQAWSNINSSLPNSCQWNQWIDNLNGAQVKVDLWTSPSFDQLQLHINDKDLGLTGNITLKLDQYNQAAAVKAPSSALNLDAVFNVQAARQARDYQRRADIDKLKKAIDAYAAANKKTPPSSLTRLTTKYIAAIPKDPNGSSYAYKVTKKTYNLSATLEDTGQLYTVNGP